MTNLSKLLLTTLVVTAILFIASCTRTCDLGYEGDHCTTPVRDKFIGTFSGSQTCSAATDTFSIEIGEVAGDVTKIKIYNIYNVGVNTIGTVLANGSVTIAPQALGVGGNISGDITASGKIRINYLVTVTGLPDASCSWVQH